MTPMMDARIAWFGIPADVLVLAIAVLVTVVGLLWLRRTLTIEPEAHSFRATSASARSWRLPAVIGLTVVAALLVAVALGAIRLG